MKLNLNTIKPIRLSVTVGWIQTTEPTPWGFAEPDMYTFTREELDEYWAANVKSGYNLTAADWYKASR